MHRIYARTQMHGPHHSEPHDVVFSPSYRKIGHYVDCYRQSRDLFFGVEYYLRLGLG